MTEQELLDYENTTEKNEYIDYINDNLNLLNNVEDKYDVVFSERNKNLNAITFYYSIDNVITKEMQVKAVKAYLNSLKKQMS